MAVEPTSFYDILVQFSGVFTQPSFRNFVTLIVGWVQVPGRITITQALRAGGGLRSGKHFSTFYRFFADAAWAADDLGHVVFELMLPFVQGLVLLVAVDDTLCRRTGPQIFGAGMHHDAVRSTYGSRTGGKRHLAFSFGHSWVILSLWVSLPWNPERGIAVPILFRLYRSKKLTPTKDYRKRTQIARELVEILAGWLKGRGRPVLLVADSEYACRNVVRRLPPDFEFAGPIVMNAALNSLDVPDRAPGQRGAPRKRGPRLPSPAELLADESVPWTRHTLTLYGHEVQVLVKTVECQWYQVTGLRPVKVILTRDPRGRWKDRAFFTTVTTATIADTLTAISRRWSLEVTFRDLKQHLGLMDPQNGWWRRDHARKKAPPPGPQPRGRRGSRAVLRTVPLVLSLYGIVYAWYFHCGNPSQDVRAARVAAPWYTHKHEPSLLDILAALRRHLATADEFVVDPGQPRFMHEFEQPRRRAA